MKPSLSVQIETSMSVQVRTAIRLDVRSVTRVLGSFRQKLGQLGKLQLGNYQVIHLVQPISYDAVAMQVKCTSLKLNNTKHLLDVT